MAGDLLSVESALAIVRAHVRPLQPRRTDLLQAAGLVLAEPVHADADSPPFDKALMDGYALRAADLAGAATGEGLLIIEEIAAGKVPSRTVEAGQASRIMTGAPLPAGADTVVPIERTTLQGDRVRVEPGRFRGGENILWRGQEMRAGEAILDAGRTLSPQDLGLLATLGQGQPLVHPRPEVAIISTGDEVVPWDATPGPGQIRNSNGPMLFAQVLRSGGHTTHVGLLGDDRGDLQAGIKAGLERDVLILSGGVSAGKFDLVPGVLAELGVTAHFHKVALKPGKPLLFGTRPRPGSAPTLVFGLPGNPVSSFVCFEIFVRPALAGLANRPVPAALRAPLAEEVRHASDRPTYHPGEWMTTPTGRGVRLVPWFGSADLRGLGRATVLVVLPAGNATLAPGTLVDVLYLENSA